MNRTNGIPAIDLTSDRPGALTVGQTAVHHPELSLK